VQEYITIDYFAKRLRVTVKKLRELQGFGWISIEEKDGKLLIAKNHEYKAKFILRLQHFLSPQEISDVLSHRNVARLLEEMRIGKPNAEIEPSHERAE